MLSHSLISLSDSLDPLVEAFNTPRGLPKLLVLVSPT